MMLGVRSCPSQVIRPWGPVVDGSPHWLAEPSTEDFHRYLPSGQGLPKTPKLSGAGTSACIMMCRLLAHIIPVSLGANS